MALPVATPELAQGDLECLLWEIERQLKARSTRTGYSSSRVTQSGRHFTPIWAHWD